MTAEAQAVQPTAIRPQAVRFRFGRAFLRQPVGLASGVVLLVVVLACILAPLITHYDPLAQDLANSYGLPSAAHPLGADRLGRDILSRLLYGGRVTLLGALLATVTSGVLGVLLGLAAASLRGTADAAILRICDLLQSIPGLIILLVVLAVFNQNESAAMLTLGILIAPGLVRVVRASAIAVREEQFVAAARVAGLTDLQIQVRHVIPAIVGPVLTQISVIGAAAILVESALGFLGLGVAPPHPTWGNLVSDANQAIAQDPWMLIPTGGVITLVSLTLTLLGNGIRDAYGGRTTRTGQQLSWRSLAARVSGTQDREAPGSFPNDAGTLLSIRNLTIELPVADGYVTVVDRVSLDVAPSASLGIVGESGCGKSMTVLGILRVLPPGARVTADRAVFDGLDLLGLTERQMSDVRGTGMAYISQEPISSLDPAFTAGQQLAEAVRQHRRVTRAEAKREALALLAQVRLPDPESVYGKYPHELSGGMAQRIAIARALAGRPRLLIADEPTTALDVTVQAEILDLLRDLREISGMAVVLVTHDWGVLADSCDETVVMYAGQIVERAGTRPLVERPSHPYSLGLLLATPSNIRSGEPLRAIEGRVPAPGSWPTGCRFFDRCAFATPECAARPIPLKTVADGQDARCIHAAAVLGSEERYDDVTIA